jgi:hypothetical protein
MNAEWMLSDVIPRASARGILIVPIEGPFPNVIVAVGLELRNYGNGFDGMGRMDRMKRR